MPPLISPPHKINHKQKSNGADSRTNIASGAFVDIKKIIHTPSCYMYKLFCLMLPTKKLKLVFISYPDAADNSWHLYRHALKNISGYKLVWLCSDRSAVEHKIKNEADHSLNTVKVLKKNSFIGLLNFLTAKYVFHTHGTYFFTSKSSGPKIINLWHGMPIKVISYLDKKERHEVPYSDFAISTSEFYSGVMAAAFSLDKYQIIQSGLPRNDVLKSPVITKKDAFQKLDVPLSSELIFWLPTYRVSVVGDIRQDSKSTSFLSDWADGFLERLNEIAEKENLYIIVKIHPMDLLNKADKMPRHERVKIINSYDWGMMGIDLYDALSHSSGLITDISSVLIDYISTQNPIGIIETGVNSYSRSTVPGVDTSALMDSCYRISSEECMHSFLKSRASCRTNKELTRFNAAIHTKETACSLIFKKFSIN